MSATSHASTRGSPIDTRLLVEEITHRIANEYTTVVASISRAAARCPDLDARIALAEGADRLLAYADVHRALQPPPDEAAVDLCRHLRALCSAIVRASLSEREISLTLVENEIAIDAERCWLACLVVSELITNAARHGLRHRGGRIVVAVSAADGMVRCVVADNGSSVGPIPGRGTRIMTALADELRGRIGWRFSLEGTIALLCFPRDPHVAPLDA